MWEDAFNFVYFRFCNLNTIGFENRLQAVTLGWLDQATKRCVNLRNKYF